MHLEYCTSALLHAPGDGQRESVSLYIDLVNFKVALERVCRNE